RWPRHLPRKETRRLLLSLQLCASFLLIGAAGRGGGILPYSLLSNRAGCIRPAMRAGRHAATIPAWVIGRSERLRQLFQLPRGLSPTLVETHLLVLLAVFGRPVPRACDVTRLAGACVLQRDNRSHERLLRRHPGTGVGVGENQLLVRHHLEHEPGIRVLVAVRIAHYDHRRAAQAEIDVDLRDRPRTGREPLLEQAHVRPAAPELLARRVEDEVEDQFVPGFCGFACHACSPVECKFRPAAVLAYSTNSDTGFRHRAKAFFARGSGAPTT